MKKGRDKTAAKRLSVRWSWWYGMVPYGFAAFPLHTERSSLWQGVKGASQQQQLLMLHYFSLSDHNFFGNAHESLPLMEYMAYRETVWISGMV